MTSLKELRVKAVSLLKESAPVHGKFKVVLMPDFYVDRVIYPPFTLEELLEIIKEYAERGGGGLQDIKQEILRGGNAANTAAVLSRLGIGSYLIVETDELGLHLMKYFFRKTSVNLEHVKTTGALSRTTSFEIKIGDNVANVMFGYAGSLANLHPDRLSEEDIELLREADIVGIFNWAGNRHGTEFFKEVCKVVKEEGRGKVFADIADPRPRIKELNGLVRNVLSKGFVDYLGLNEIEAEVLVKTSFSRGKVYEGLAKASEEWNMVFILHTSYYSKVFDPKKSGIRVPSFKVTPLRSTGAGDSFNAGVIYSLLLGFNYETMLTVANGVAGYYISKEHSPSLEELIHFIKTTPLRDER